MSLRPVVLPFLFALGLAACADTPQVIDRRGEVGGRAFEFSSDDRAGEGEWLVRLRGDALWVALDKDGKTTQFGTFGLTRSETDQLWRLIDEARMDRRKGSTRAGEPGEISYMFSLIRPKKKNQTVELWFDEAWGDERLGKLMGYLGTLIKKYTGRTPTFASE